MGAGRRRKRTTQREGVIGAMPGTLAPEPDAPKPVMRTFSYGPESCDEVPACSVDDVAARLGRDPVLWVNVDGLGDADTIRALGGLFHLHDLALEDVLSVHHRAKLERFGAIDFLVMRMPEILPDGTVGTDQLSMFWGERFVLTFQQHPGDCFDPVRARIRAGKGRIRKSGADYLVYALLDAVIDSYYPVLESRGEQIERLEDIVLTDARRKLVGEIHDVRRDLLTLRRAVWPVREILNELMRDEDINVELRPFLRDAYDHVIELVDMIETYRDLSTGLMEMYVSAVGNRMNEIMKVLTIIATIFIPLTFIAGIYGMNFDNIPELHWKYGYLTCLGAMLLATGLMVWWFKKRGWILDPGDAER